MNIPQQSSPVIRNPNAFRTIAQKSGIQPAAATPEEIAACMARCSSSPNSTSRQICQSLCRDL